MRIISKTFLLLGLLPGVFAQVSSTVTTGDSKEGVPGYKAWIVPAIARQNATQDKRIANGNASAESKA